MNYNNKTAKKIFSIDHFRQGVFLQVAFLFAVLASNKTGTHMGLPDKTFGCRH